MWQMVFTLISIEGWIIDPYVQILFYCSHLVQVLPPSNVEIVDGNIVTSDVTVVIYGRGGFRYSLNLLPTVLEDSPIYSSSQSTLSHWYLYMTPLCFCIGSLSLGVIRRFLMVMPQSMCFLTNRTNFVKRDKLSIQMNQMRTIKEDLYIRVNDPSLNRNKGKYHLPHVWDEVLLNTSELKLK